MSISIATYFSGNRSRECRAACALRDTAIDDRVANGTLGTVIRRFDVPIAHEIILGRLPFERPGQPLLAPPNGASPAVFRQESGVSRPVSSEGLLTVDHYELIRRKVLIEGLSQRQVARALTERLPPGYRLSEPRPRPVLEPVKPIIDAWLEQNSQTRPKQRQTAPRIYERLCDEYNFTGHYGTVQRYVKQASHRQTEAFMPLQFDPGEEAQVDWHEGWIIENGIERKCQFFVMKLCYSKAAFVMCIICSGKRLKSLGLRPGDYLHRLPSVRRAGERVALEVNFMVFGTDSWYKEGGVHLDLQSGRGGADRVGWRLVRGEALTSCVLFRHMVRGEPANTSYLVVDILCPHMAPSVCCSQKGGDGTNSIGAANAERMRRKRLRNMVMLVRKDVGSGPSRGISEHNFVAGGISWARNWFTSLLVF